MKTSPEEAKKKILATRLESVRTSVRQKTHQPDSFKDLILVVAFTMECEGKRSSGRTEESRYNFMTDSRGNKVHLNGAEKNWSTWKAPSDPIRKAILTAVYGTTNINNDPGSNTAKLVVWKTKQVQRALTARVRRAVTSRTNSEKISAAHRSARKKAVAEAVADLLKSFPEMRKQDFLVAFETAKKVQVIQEVMGA